MLAPLTVANQFRLGGTKLLFDDGKLVEARLSKQLLANPPHRKNVWKPVEDGYPSASICSARSTRS
jgi:hypothetical protein